MTTTTPSAVRIKHFSSGDMISTGSQAKAANNQRKSDKLFHDLNIFKRYRIFLWLEN